MHSPLPRFKSIPVHATRPFSAHTLRVAFSLLFVAMAARTVLPQAEINPWKPSGSVYWIANPIRLNIGYTDQNGKPTAAEVSSLSAQQLAGLPPGLLQAKGSVLFTAGHFDTLWTAMKGGICSDVQQAISTLENHSPNSPYNIQPCIMNPKGYLTANFQESWEDDSMNMVNGRRVRFTFQAPLNGVTFWMTSPHTCHVGSNCPTEPTDPAFTVVFTVYLTVTCTSTPNATSFDLPVSCTPAVDVSVDGVYGGDVTGQLVASTTKFVTQLAAEGAAAAASGGTVAPEAAIGAITSALNLAVQGIGTLIAADTDQHLRDQVSFYIVGFLNSPTLDSNSTSVSNDFNALFQNLYQAYLGGLRPFVVAISPKLDFDFGLVYPAPAKPQIQNTTAANNKGSLFSQTIAVSQPEVVAGQMLPVTASFFRGAYVNALNIAWNKTVLGDTKSSLAWGPPKVTITTPALTFNAIDLKPATQYTFQVHECDGISLRSAERRAHHGYRGRGQQRRLLLARQQHRPDHWAQHRRRCRRTVPDQRSHSGCHHAGRASAACQHSRRPACNSLHHCLPGGRLRADGRRAQHLQQHSLSAGLGSRGRAAGGCARLKVCSRRLGVDLGGWCAGEEGRAPRRLACWATSRRISPCP